MRSPVYSSYSTLYSHTPCCPSNETTQGNAPNTLLQRHKAVNPAFQSAMITVHVLNVINTFHTLFPVGLKAVNGLNLSNWRRN